MVTNAETTVKMSRWLLEEIDGFIGKSKKNRAEFPSKRVVVDRAVMSFLEERGVNMD